MKKSAERCGTALFPLFCHATIIDTHKQKLYN